MRRAPVLRTAAAYDSTSTVAAGCAVIAAVLQTDVRVKMSVMVRRYALPHVTLGGRQMLATQNGRHVMPGIRQYMFVWS